MTIMPLSEASDPRTPVPETPPPAVTEKEAHHYRRAARLGTFLDDAFRIPIIGKRVGWDAIIGMIPFAGDWLSGAFSALMVLEARRAGAPGVLIVKMVKNIALDVLVGMIPIAGDLFDFAFKANRRNAALLREHLESLSLARG